jgi:phosphomannomutase / phosphoglucomutase
MTLPPHVFREYDIRGIVGEDLTPGLAGAVGRAYGTNLVERWHQKGGAHRPRVVVGWDNRSSSPPLVEALVDGLTTSGVDVLELGLVPTPVTWWAEKTLPVEGALQVTGSHNPPEWNGIKMTLLGRSLYGEGVQALRRRIEAGTLVPGEGSRSSHPVLDAYVEDVARRIRLSRPVKVVVDCGNGTGSVVAERLLTAVGAEVIPLFCESDGSFPNHHPDPTVDENLEELIRQVRAHQAEVGVAFDGDADRIGAVDDRGRIIRGDVLLLLYGLDLLDRRGPGQLLLFDVKCSQVLPEVYEAAGGETLMWKTGHSLMKEKMLETGAPIAGELSGHICFADEYLGIDDALYGAARLAEMVSNGTEPLSRQVDRFPRFVSTRELRIEVPEERKVEIVERAAAHFGAYRPVIAVDGARILFDGGWGLLRASNTQPVLVARYEARTEAGLTEIRTEVEDWLQTQGVHA